MASTSEILVTVIRVSAVFGNGRCVVLRIQLLKICLDEILLGSVVIKQASQPKAGDIFELTNLDKSS